ncbi:MAG TPA: tetratricopeptide repeat protein [Chitinophagaceae bacterium]|nr:tetratricopeptide repeat protein [Chitinophagaceae bacterium]
MKRPQWITALAGVVLLAVLYVFGKTVPDKKPAPPGNPQESATASLSIDTILLHAKQQLKPDQLVRVNALEKSVVRGDVHNQQLAVYHRLAHFWGDTARIFEPYAWYEAEAARLENSEKSLTFAAHLFLGNLRDVDDPALKKWEALQAKDLFERSLKINPANDSSLVGLGACYLFGGIAETPMEGILKVKSVADRDSTNVFAQSVLGYGSVMSGQYDKAIARFRTVARLQPDNLEAILILADLYERISDKRSAIEWYNKALPLLRKPDMKAEVEKRIRQLGA